MLFPGDGDHDPYLDDEYAFSSDDEEEDLGVEFHLRDIIPDSLSILHLGGDFTTEESDDVRAQLNDTGKPRPNLKDARIVKSNEELPENPLWDLFDGHWP